MNQRSVLHAVYLEVHRETERGRENIRRILERILYVEGGGERVKNTENVYAEGGGERERWYIIPDERNLLQASAS